MILTVSTPELADAVGEVAGVEVRVWDGTGDPPAGTRIWAAPYGTGAEVMDGAARFDGELEVVQLQSAGYDGMVERLPDGLTLCNARGVHDDPTAEHAVALILAAIREIPRAVRAQDAGTWETLPDREALADRRVLILGYGSIGREVAQRLRPMKVELTGVATRERDDDLVGRVRAIGDLPDLLPDQDVAVVLLPLTEQTRGLVDRDLLARLPDGALLVNVARGPVVDTDAVLADGGRLRFALDVTDPEPLPEGHPLWSAPGVLITPHIAGGTTAMLPRIAALVREQAERLVAGKRPLHVVAP